MKSLAITVVTSLYPSSPREREGVFAERRWVSMRARGHDVRTVESIADDDLAAMTDSGATQCGACSPGVAMTARWVCANPGLLAGYDVRELMAGNLCRCTGYDGILEGLARDLEKGGPSR